MSEAAEVENETVEQAEDYSRPMITPQHVNNKIVRADFHLFEGTTTTVCCLTLENGFTVIGESACIHPEHYNKEKGEEIARQDAEHKVYLLEGYLLKQVLSFESQPKH